MFQILAPGQELRSGSSAQSHRPNAAITRMGVCHSTAFRKSEISLYTCRKISSSVSSFKLSGSRENTFFHGISWGNYTFRYTFHILPPFLPTWERRVTDKHPIPLLSGIQTSILLWETFCGVGLAAFSWLRLMFFRVTNRFLGCLKYWFCQYNKQTHSSWVWNKHNRSISDILGVITDL